MTFCLIASIVLTGATPAREPADLVAQLGAPRYAEREAAAQALEKLGAAALPALREKSNANDPEVRSRIAELLERIERETLLSPTLIELDFQKKPLDEVIAAFNTQSGARLVLDPDLTKIGKTRKITLREPEPVPFWTALDHFLEAGKLRDTPVSRMAPNAPEIFSLSADRGGTSAQTFDSGPFRAQISARSRFFGFIELQMLLMSEPRLTLSPGDLNLVEAVDDRGMSLLTDDSRGHVLRTHCANKYDGSVVRAEVYLRLARWRGGRSIKRLQGSVPVAVAERRTGPDLTLPLTGAEGKSFASGGMTLEFTKVDVENGKRASLELAIRCDASGGTELDLDDSQIEVVDARDRPLRRVVSNRSRIGPRGRWILTFEPGTDTSAPAQIRCYDLMRATAEIPFEFSDVPVPW